MLRTPRFLLILVFWFSSLAALASPENAAQELEAFNQAGDFSLIASQVIDQTPFYGLAAYYNGVGLYTVSADQVERLEPGQTVALEKGEWFAAVGRFNVLVLNTPGANLNIGEKTFTVTNTQSLPPNAAIVRKDMLGNLSPELDQLRYQHLWWPFAQISRLVEWSLVQLKAITGLGWGISIVLFTVILKILLVPLGISTARMQKQVSLNQTKLAPVLAAIKEQYDGNEAHTRIMDAHKELGITTFFTLKPMMPMLIQIPIWVAVFNALGEMPQLDGQVFLWIDNLAYPDAIGVLPATVPLLGNSVSLLPLLMTLVTILSAILTQDRQAPMEEQKKQKRNGYLIALAFFVLFYPFPAAMVLYWTLSNALQIVQQKLIKP